MIVCDICKDVKVDCFHIKTDVIKIGSSKRKTISIDMHLCNKCLDIWHKELGYLKIKVIKKEQDI